MLTINNNTASLAAQAALNNTSTALNTSLQRLSTGLQINSGADGPAALVISQEQQAQVVGLQQAITNTSEAVNVVQTAEGGLNEISNLLSQARSLALDSANSGVNDQTALDANQAQLANILSTIDNIANTTQFGQKQLLNGTAGLDVISTPAGYSLSTTGATVGGTYTLSGYTPATKANSTAGSAYSAVTAASAANIVINGYSVALNAGNAGGATAAQALTNVVSTLNAVSSQTGVTAVANGTSLELVSNSFGNGGNFTVGFTGANADALAAATGFGATAALGAVNTASATNGVAAVNAAGTLTGADGAHVGVGSGNTLSFSSGDAAGLTITFAASGTTGSAALGSGVINFNNNALQFQIGANAGQTASIAINGVNTTSLGQNAQGVVGSFTSLNNININTTNSNTADAVRIIDKAIQDVSTENGAIGAFQTNTLQANADNLQTALTNTTAAESTIRDTDYASEISNYSSLQVQLQAGASVLGNANQLPAIVTQLLQKT